MPISSPCRPLRLERDDVLWFVTCRTTEERFWLHPLIACGLQPPLDAAKPRLRRLQKYANQRIRAMVRDANARRRPHSPPMDTSSLKRIARGLVGSALARAQKRYGVELFALVVMSDHVHLVVRTTQQNLSAFVGYLKARIADSVNRITGRRGVLWARRYDAEPILDDHAAETLTAYTLRNPVKAQLVQRYDHWPSLNLAFGLAHADDLDFEYLHCTRWHRAHRPRDLAPFFETTTLKLSPLPHCAHIRREVYRRMLESWIDRAQDDDSLAAPTLGVEAIVRADFRHRSPNAVFRRRPYAFGSAVAVAKHRVLMDKLHHHHARASKRWRDGIHHTPFPPGTYRPPIVVPA